MTSYRDAVKALNEAAYAAARAARKDKEVSIEALATTSNIAQITDRLVDDLPPLNRSVA